MWKATKYLKRPAQINFPILRQDGTWAKNNQEKADLLAGHFEKVFRPNIKARGYPNNEGKGREDAGEGNADMDRCPTPLPRKLPPQKIKEFSLTEISDEIKYKVKVKKAPGFDRITGLILKQLPSVVIRKLAAIFNAVLRNRYVPSQWKKAEIIVLLKPGKSASEPTSYRPISLLPAIGKLFERLYIKRLKKIVDNKKIILDAQFGFRDKHSTIEQLHRITSSIEEALERKEYCVAVFLDVAQAFDRVWHEKLIYKLYSLLPANHVELLASYLKDRCFRVRFGDTLSEFKPIKGGVPQGSVLAPLLYSLFTADIPQPRMGGKLGIFADDTLTMATSRNYETAVRIVQAHLGDIQEWTAGDRTKLNETKSVEVVFSNRAYNHIPLVLNNVIIPHKNYVKNLDLTLDEKLKWKKPILNKKNSS